MKKSILAFILLFSFSLEGFSQTEEDGDTNCYLEWAKVFEKRGANEVEDGVYTDVIITIRSGSEAECYEGKCEVREGQITAMYLKLEDGKYEELKRKARLNVPIRVVNGISNVMVTLEDELINVLFVSKIKPKKASPKQAKGPSDF